MDSPEQELRTWVSRFDPKDQKRLRAVRSAVRALFPTANELAYDYKTHIVLAFSPTTRGIDAVVAIDARAGDLRLYLNRGPQLPDPKGLLQGTGKQTRFVAVETAGQLAEPDLAALIGAARDQATIAMPAAGKGTLIVQSSAAKKRPRKKPAK